MLHYNEADSISSICFDDTATLKLIIELIYSNISDIHLYVSMRWRPFMLIAAKVSKISLFLIGSVFSEIETVSAVVTANWIMAHHVTLINVSISKT